MGKTKHGGQLLRLTQLASSIQSLRLSGKLCAVTGTLKIDASRLQWG